MPAMPCRFVVAFALLLVIQPALAVSALFINPGRTNEPYWAAVSKAMHMAANSLGMQLEVLYAERDHVRVVALAQGVAQRPRAQRPDYVIITNDYGTAPEMLRVLAPAAIPTLMAFSGLGEADAAEGRRLQAQFPFWLGSIEPSAETAGYLTAQALIEQARIHSHAFASDGKLHLFAIAGDRSTPSSVQRTRGMHKAVAEHADVVLEQVVFGDWSGDKAEEQASWLYRRYPQARLVWSGNDEMALGAIRAWKERGGRPGADAWFSGINTSPQAMQALRRGELAALAGGHFLTGAWAMVLVYDHAHGRDFRSAGRELVFPMFMLFDSESSLRFEERFDDGTHALDFRPYSKALNPALEQYPFSPASLLR